jgi:hypothetical protein
MAMRQGDGMIQSDNRVKMLAANIRRVLATRHGVGTAVRERLEKMSDEALVALDARETAAKIARIKAKNDKQN